MDPIKENEKSVNNLQTNFLNLYQRIETMQPWELVECLESENLDVSGSMEQLRDRLWSCELQKIHSYSFLTPTGDIDLNKDWTFDHRYMQETEDLLIFKESNSILRHGYHHVETVQPVENKVLTVKDSGSDVTEEQPKPHLETITVDKEDKIPSDMELCQEIIKDLLSDKHANYAWPFSKPVRSSTLGFKDYHDIIKNPMDLRTVKRKMSEGHYKTPSEFAADVRLIFENCYKYFQSPNHEYVVLAKKLERAFETSYTEVCDDRPSTDDHKIAKTTSAMQKREESDKKSMELLLERVKALEEELVLSNKRIATLEAAASQEQRAEHCDNKTQKSGEDELNYRLKCAKLIKLWFRNPNEPTQQFFENLKEFRKFAKINDELLLEILPCVLPENVKHWYRKKEFKSWTTFEEKFCKKLSNVNNETYNPFLHYLTNMNSLYFNNQPYNGI